MNVIAKTVRRVHHALQADALDRTSLVNPKTLINKIELFKAILFLMEKNFSERGAPGTWID